MRVSTNNLYSKFIYEQQKVTDGLNEATNQLATGLKISDMSDDPQVFTNTLRLDAESSNLKQVVKTSKDAQKFANSTDTTINDMVTTLTSFKTKLIQSVNGANDSTSLGALAEDLKGLRKHLQQLANTSINGKFLFSGTMIDTKPFDDAGNYHGNNQHLKAKLGSGVEREYNIDGATLFQGIDKDYHKKIETNIQHFNLMKEHPEFVVLKDGKYYIDKNIKEHNQTPASDEPPKKVSLTTESQIRQLTGVADVYHSDTDSYTDGTSYFYVRGRKPDGETFSAKLALSNSAKIEDLLEKIGELFGNNDVTKSVEVKLNEFGQISVKDLKSGKMVTELAIVASDKDEKSLKDVVKNGDYTVVFTKSNFAPLRELSEVTAQNKNFNNKVFSLNSEFRTLDKEEFARPTDKIRKVMSPNVSSLHLTGKDTSGNDVDVSLDVDNDTTMQDLMNKIKDNFGDVKVVLDHGKLHIIDNTIEKDETSKLSFKMDAKDKNGNAVIAFAKMDRITDDETYFKKDGRQLISNVRQVNKKTQLPATEDTELIDVSGKDDIDGKQLKLNFVDAQGNTKTATITLRDTPDSNGHLSTFTIDGKTYDIFDREGNKTPIHDVTKIIQEFDPSTCELCNKEHTTKGMSYRQLNDVIGMLMSGKLPKNNDFNSYKKAVDESKQEVEVNLQDGRIVIEDKKNAVTPMKFEMHDADTDSYDGSNPVFTFNSNNALTIDEAKVDIFHQLDKMIESVEHGKIESNGEDTEDPRNIGVENSIELIDHIMDHINKMHTKIGAVSKSLEHIQERNEILITHVETLKSDIADADLAEASMKLQKLKLNYQAILASVAKINNLSLVNYMR